jgi:asparagine synthase (glutamine-hydrolysing)
MCGIAGFVDSRPASAAELDARARRMADQLVHRGPDDSGVWVEPARGIGFGFRRLSILDLSPAGHQPMTSASGRYVIVFNGEVYNFAALRSELESAGHRFRGGSDTEVMLAAFEAWGLDAALKRFVGMFAFALWDARERELHLVRDRMGIKPLYYAFSRGAFIFGSELKALRAHPECPSEIDRGALTLFLRHGYIPAPYSIYRGISKLRPGSVATLALGAGQPAPPQELNLRSYWSLREVAARGEREPFQGSEADAIQELERLLRESVRLRMIADVPLGAFLSGGVDSSLVVALMQSEATGRVKTFTIGFEDPEYNEAGHAAQVAAHLSTEHTQLILTAAETRAVIPKLPVLYDEPFADASQIPTYLVSALARRSVTVSLSGDGGDELFGGYTHYTRAPWLLERLGRIPPSARRALSGVLRLPSVPAYNRIFGRRRHTFSAHARPATAGEKFHKLAQALDAAGPWQLHRHFSSLWKSPEEVVIDGYEPPTIFTDASERADSADFARQMMTADARMYLPDDILTKVDRASMAVSLETRVPILDHRCVEFAARLPLHMKIRGRQGKWLLRRTLDRFVPARLIERPKMGFAAPIGAWLRGPLREWGEALLAEDRIKREGILHPQPVRELWQEHLSGDRNGQEMVWCVLMFQAWLERWA